VFSNSWHHYLLLRPLLVFVLAGPLIVLATLFRLTARPRSEDRAPDNAAPGALPPGREPRVESGPSEWRESDGRSDRRAA
jgi:hypothetical protein